MSEVKVNKISPRTNCGTVTLGDSGDTFSIPAGVTLTNSGTATGFGPTGAVSWNTTKITADPNPAVSGVGYFADTSSAAFTVTLPAAPSAGDIVAFKDYANTWDTNNLTINRNGSNIEGLAINSIQNIEGQSITLIYVDSTKGWVIVDSAQFSDLNQATYIVASGGTVSCCGDYKIHTFTGPGTFTVCSVGNPLGSTAVDYLIVAGGGSGASDDGGGGGAGGLRFSASTYSAPAPGTPFAGSVIPVSATAYPITVGSGGAGVTAGPLFPNGNNGNPTTALGLTSTGGGYGATNRPSTNGGPGGSGGGAASSGSAGAGNTPPVAPPQGSNGGAGASVGGAGGGGFLGNGTPGASPLSNPGGPGINLTISGTPVTYAAGGLGDSPAANTPNATANTGNGSDGSNSGAPSSTGNGGSGIVVIRYKFQ